MELFFLAMLFLLMMYALGSGYPVAFALPGSAIITIVVAGIVGQIFTGDSGAYFIQDGPVEWLTAGVINFRGIYWEVERDTLIAIPLFIFMGIMDFSKIPWGITPSCPIIYTILLTLPTSVEVIVVTVIIAHDSRNEETTMTFHELN